MIKSLYVKNIALIRELEIELGTGLNVISGETGAGKSIIIDSLNFVLGDRADRSLIRHGETTACVQAVFTDDNVSEIADLLAEYGIERDDYIIVRRVMTEGGKSECRINGAAVNLAQLKRLVVLLVDVHSQHEHQSLLNEANHIKILDKYCAKELTPFVLDFRARLRAYLCALEEKSTFTSAEERARATDLLEFQLAEIDRVALKDNEEEELVAKRTKFQNAERITYALNAALVLLDGEEGFAALSDIQNSKRELSAISRFDPKYDGLIERLDSAKIELADIASELSSELERAEFDPRELEETEKRIEEIRKIKRRFGANLQEIDAFYAKAQAELARLQGAEERIAELDGIIKEESSAIVTLARKLHAIRTSAAKQFAEAILANLRDLGMKSSTFNAEIVIPETDEEILATAHQNGADTVRFLISPNLGEPLKPLAKIASGGEMSRFMLGLKNITAELEGIDSLVFDEIDTGISGAIAKVVACKLYNIARSRQVLAVTHLPQLASMADTHYLITKSETDGKTLTHLTKLNEGTSLAELMRLSGSAEGSAAGLESAKELKAWADEYKKS